MADDGTILPPGSLGEIVIRGRNVTAGYENNPEANAKAFTDGWFRTGDEGYLDNEGYLRLTGRLKEISSEFGLDLVFKASFDKANRTSYLYPR